MGDAPPPPPELRTVRLSTVIHRAVERCYKELTAVAQRLEEKSDRDRKIALRDCFQNARNRLIKLLVLVKWSAHVPAVKASWDLEHFLIEQDASLEGAAARLYNFMGTIKDARAPNYDIPTAIDVLATGTYSPLPTAIKNIIPPAPVTEDEEKQILKRLNDIISMRLFHSKLPPHFSVRVEDGRVYLKVKNEFEVSLTVYGEDPTLGTEAEQVKKYPWVVLGIDLFISSSAGVKEDTEALFPSRFMHVLKDRLQQRMARADHPLEELYIIMHAVCVPLQIGVLATQAQVLSRRLAPDVKVDYVPEKELRIYYWRELAAVKYPGQVRRDVGSDGGWPIYLQIVVDERQLTVTHAPHLVNPVTSEEVQLVVKSTSLNLEQLFQQAVQYHSYSLLHALHEALFADAKLGLAFDDVRLISANQGKQTYLKVRLFNPHCLFVSVDLRSGRFLLKAPVGIIDPEVLQPLEARLNKDATLIPSIVRELRHKALLYHFSRIASAESLRVEAFHELLKAPPPPAEADKEPQHVFSKNTLYLRFRDVPDYYLAIEIDEQDFTPKFYLLVTKKSTQSSLIYVQQVVSLADALSKSSPFLVPSLSASSLLVPPHTPFSTFATPMASPYTAGLMSPSPIPSPASFLHEQASIPADIARQIKQETEAASLLRRRDKGKERTGASDGTTPGASPPASPSAGGGGAKRKAGGDGEDGSAGGEDGSSAQEEIKAEAAGDAKRPRLAAAQASLAGDRVVPYQSLLASIVSNCRKTITSFMMRRFFEESKPITYKVLDNGDILFTIPLNDVKMPIKQMRISFLGDFRWVVITEESQPTFTLLAPFIAAKQPPHLASGITYEPGLGWRFQYDHVADDKADSLKLFLRQLRGVTRMTTLANGLEAVLSNPGQYGHLIRYFEVHRFTPTHLVLRFDEGRKELLISVSEEASFEISLSGFECSPVAPLLELMLNARRSIADLLEALYRTSEPLDMINGFLHNATPDTNNYVLANDFCLIPRDVTHVRLIYKNTLGVDFRFLPNNLIHIEDASSSPSSTGLPPGITGSLHRRHQLLPLTNFQAFYAEHLQPLVAPTLPPLPQQQQQQDKPAAAAVTGLLTRDVFTDALGLLHRFMGALYLYRQAGAVLKNEGFEDVKAEKPNKMVFTTVNKQSFSISIVNHVRLTLHAKNERKQETTALFGVPKPAAQERPDLTEEESSVLEDFFQRHVASPPFYHAVSHMTSLVRLLTLPLPVLQKYVQLMKRENDQSRRLPASSEAAAAASTTSATTTTSTGLRWLLAAPPLFSSLPAGQPAVFHDRTAASLSFVVGFNWRGKVPIGIGLQYRYQERAWAAWAAAGQEPAATGTPAPLQQLLASLPPNTPEGMVVVAAVNALAEQPLETLLALAGLEPHPPQPPAPGVAAAEGS